MYLLGVKQGWMENLVGLNFGDVVKGGGVSYKNHSRMVFLSRPALTDGCTSLLCNLFPTKL